MIKEMRSCLRRPRRSIFVRATEDLRPFNFGPLAMGVEKEVAE